MDRTGHPGPGNTWTMEKCDKIPLCKAALNSEPAVESAANSQFEQTVKKKDEDAHHAYPDGETALMHIEIGGGLWASLLLTDTATGTRPASFPADFLRNSLPELLELGLVDAPLVLDAETAVNLNAVLDSQKLHRNYIHYKQFITEQVASYQEIWELLALPDCQGIWETDDLCPDALYRVWRWLWPDEATAARPTTPATGERACKRGQRWWLVRHCSDNPGHEACPAHTHT